MISGVCSQSLHSVQLWRVPQRQHASSGLVEQLEMSVTITKNLMLLLNSSLKRLQKVVHFRIHNFCADSSWVRMYSQYEREALLQVQDMIYIYSRTQAKEDYKNISYAALFVCQSVWLCLKNWNGVLAWIEYCSWNTLMKWTKSLLIIYCGWRGRLKWCANECYIWSATHG